MQKPKSVITGCKGKVGGKRKEIVELSYMDGDVEMQVVYDINKRFKTVETTVVHGSSFKVVEMGVEASHKEP